MRRPPRKRKGQGSGPRRLNGVVLDVPAAAELLGATEKVVRARAARGLLPWRRWGGRILFLLSARGDAGLRGGPPGGDPPASAQNPPGLWPLRVRLPPSAQEFQEVRRSLSMGGPPRAGRLCLFFAPALRHGRWFLAGRARLARAENAREVLARIPEVLDVLRCHMEELRAGRAPLENLVITRTLSKEPGQYVREDAGAVAAKALARAGVKLHPGERIGYVILNAKAKVKEERSRPAICLRGDESYDKARISDLTGERTGV